MSFAEQTILNQGNELVLRRKESNTAEEESHILLSSDNYKNDISFVIPSSVLPFRFDNFGILISYFNAGVAFTLLLTPVSYYLIHTLGCSSAQVNAFTTLIYLPWSLKFVFGLIADNGVIFGSRQKAWMIIDWVIYVLVNFILFTFAKPNLLLITIFMFISSCSYLQAHVCNDAQSVERAHFECMAIKGSFQNAAFSIRSFGYIIGSVQASLFYNTSSWGWGLTLSQMFLLAVLIPIFTVLPFSYFIPELHSTNSESSPPLSLDSFYKVWEVLQLKAVWSPMIFFLTYQCLKLPNPAWSNYLVLSLHFTDFDLGMMTIGGSIGYFFGLRLYQMFFFSKNFQEVVLTFGILYALTNLAQLILIYQWNHLFGISNLVFAIFLYSIQFLLSAISSMPLTIICIMVCPQQSEGIIYSMLTTQTNLSDTIAYDLATLLTYTVDISNESLMSSKFVGLKSMVCITTVVQLIPLYMLLSFVPTSREKVQESIDGNDKSQIGSGVLIIYLIACLILTLMLNCYIVVTSAEVG